MTHKPKLDIKIDGDPMKYAATKREDEKYDPKLDAIYPVKYSKWISSEGNVDNFGGEPKRELERMEPSKEAWEAGKSALKVCSFRNEEQRLRFAASAMYAIDFHAHQQAIQGYERWMHEVLTDFKIPFDDHTIGKRMALLDWMQRTAQSMQADQEQLNKAQRDLGELVKIADRCPSCNNQTLFIGSGGYLACSWIECKNPCVGRAITEQTQRAQELEARVGEAEKQVADADLAHSITSGTLNDVIMERDEALERADRLQAEVERLRSLLNEFNAGGIKMAQERDALTQQLAEQRGENLPHMCRDGHEIIRHKSDGELCPLCNQRTAMDGLAAVLRKIVAWAPSCKKGECGDCLACQANAALAAYERGKG